MFKNLNLRVVVLACVLVVGPLKGYCEEEKNDWSARVTFDPITTGFNKYSNSFSVGLTFYRHLYKDLDLALGGRLEESWRFDSAPNIPIFTGLHFDAKSKEISPVIDFETGFSIRPSGISYSSYFLNPMVGVRIGRWGIGIGYYGSVALGVDNAGWGSAMNIRLAYYFMNQRGFNDYSRFIDFLRSTDFTVSLGYEIASASKKYFADNMSTVALNVAWLLPVCKNFEMGPSVGVNLSVGDVDFIYLPIALRSRYNIKQATFAKRFYPWVQLDLGGAFRDGGDYKVGSFLARPAVGVSMDVRGGKSALDLSVGYSSVGAELNRDYSSDGKHYINNVGIALGYRF